MRRLAGNAAFFARHFYGALFALDPALRPVFRTDMAAQGVRLVRMLQLAVDGLAAPDDLAPALHALGRRHAAYGVRHYDFETVRLALMCALECQPDAVPGAAVRDAWDVAWRLLAREVQLGALDGGAAAMRRPGVAYPAH